MRRMCDKALCEPLVSSSVTGMDDSNSLPSPDYKAYPPYHMEPSGSHPEGVSAPMDTKPSFEEVSSCNFARPNSWGEEAPSVGDVKPQVSIKREVVEQESRDGESEGGQSVIRCVDTSMPPPDGVCYDPRSRRPSGGFARPLDVPRAGEVIRSHHGSRYREVRRMNEQTRPDQPRPPDLNRHGESMRMTDCPPPPPSSSPSSSTTPTSSAGRPRATGKKERKKEETDDVSSSIPDLGKSHYNVVGFPLNCPCVVPTFSWVLFGREHNFCRSVILMTVITLLIMNPSHFRSPFPVLPPMKNSAINVRCSIPASVPRALPRVLVEYAIQSSPFSQRVQRWYTMECCSHALVRPPTLWSTCVQSNR